MCLIVDEKSKCRPKIGFKVVIRAGSKAYSLCGLYPKAYPENRVVNCKDPEGFHCFTNLRLARRFLTLLREASLPDQTGGTAMLAILKHHRNVSFGLIGVRARGTVRVGHHRTDGTPFWNYANRKPGFTCTQMQWDGRFIE